ncbi:hypothetical protein [Polymorphobacter megasporae]|uniref:hypothetical protein n=1 Tax=Glacieibacterium megasporae TaxID=2835787 RepID=UPI001C1DCFDC|nr:hypothetical protein [Polymorphobacter megasporae]UAJ12611.1 hypothetical protein KTC28_18790 [Polymorphobacter megasporae]
MAIKAKPFKKKTLDAVEAAATKVAVTATSVARGEGKAYEAWVLMELAARLAVENTVVACDHTGSPTNVFRVRGGPGYMPVATSTNLDEPCHFRIGKWRELHSGLRHRGQSGDSHELDISVIDAWAADILRRSSVPAPFEGVVCVAVELKEYDDSYTLPKTYARALLGVALDLNPAKLCGPVEIVMRGKINHWLEGSSYPTTYVLMTTTAFTAPTKGLLEFYDVLPVECAEVMAGSAAVDHLAGLYL